MEDRCSQGLTPCVCVLFAYLYFLVSPEWRSTLLIKEKTQLAIASGLGGVMVWHYGCDTPSGSGNSLFDTIQQVKDEATLN